MAGTNDLTKVDIKTFQNLSEVLSIIRSESPDTAVSLSQVPVRNDIPNSGQKVADFNNKMKTFANHHNCGLLEMNKIDGSCLGKGKLHFNQKGNKMLASIFIDFCKDLWSECNIVSESEELANEISINQGEEICENSAKHNVSCFDKIKDLKTKNPNNPTCAYLNINSVTNKLENLATMLQQNIDILCLAETKIDNSYPTGQFILQGYKTPYRLDVSSNSGGILVYI